MRLDSNTIAKYHIVLKYHVSIMMYVISISKTYKHRGKNIIHKQNTKKHWQIMYYEYDEDDNFKLHSKFVNPLQAFYYKLNKFYKRKFYCSECERIFEALVKKRVRGTDCPYCEL